MNYELLANLSFPLPTTYIGLCVLLYLTGAGIPIPEEITLVLAGAAVYAGPMHYFPVILVALCGVMAADMQVYCIGRFFGRRLLDKKLFHVLLPPEKLQKAEQRFAGHSTWAVFTVRFISGLRGPTYFTAGTLRLPALRFFLIDLSAACIHVVAFTALGYAFSPHVERIVEYVKKADRWGGIAVIMALVLLAVFIGYRLGKRRKIN